MLIKEILPNTSSLIFVLGLVSLCLGCKQEPCKIDFNKFSPGKAPYICIDSADISYNYFFRGHFTTNNKHVYLHGVLTFENDGFYLDFDSVFVSKVKYFDFSVPVSKSYDIPFRTIDSSFVLKSTIVEIVSTKNKGKVYIFRVNKAYCHRDGYLFDLVFFVSKVNGIIGSYVSEITPEYDGIVFQRGDILADELDYSNKSFRISE